MSTVGHSLDRHEGALSQRRNDKFISYSTKQELTSNVVASIFEDSKQALCIPRECSRVECICGKIGRVTSIAHGSSDGMKTTECNGNFSRGWLEGARRPLMVSDEL